MKTYRLLLSLFRYQPWRYLYGVAMRTLIFTAAPHATGLAIRAFFDALTDEQAVSFGAYTICAFLVAIAIVRSGLIFADIPVHFSAQFRAGALLRKNLIESILDRPGARALPDSTGEAISRFRGDVDTVTNYLGQLPFQAGNVLFSVIAFYVMFTIDARISVVVFAPFVLTIVLLNYSQHRIRRFRQASRDAAGRVTGFIAELFEDALAIRLANRVDRMIGRLDGLNETRRIATLKDTLFSRILDSMVWNATNVGTGVILIMAGQSMQTGTFSIGDFALFVFYLGWTSMLVQATARTIAQYKQAEVSVDRMLALMEGEPDRIATHDHIPLTGDLPEPPAIVRSPGDLLERLEIRGLAYRYPGSDAGIADVSFVVDRGSFTVVTGRIGSGKTTLIRVLLGLLPRDAGDILWNGTPVNDAGEWFVPPRCAYTPQVPRLFSDSLRDNILLGLPEDAVDLPGAIDRAILSPDIDDLEDGLDTRVGSRGVKLSGGQAQRAATARMLVRDPELLVFDDVSSALDIETERQLWAGLFDRDGADTTSIVVSHRRPALQRADRILLLENGRITASGRLDDLLRESEEMRRLWEGRID